MGRIYQVKRSENDREVIFFTNGRKDAVEAAKLLVAEDPYLTPYFSPVDTAKWDRFKNREKVFRVTDAGRDVGIKLLEVRDWQMLEDPYSLREEEEPSAEKALSVKIVARTVEEAEAYGKPTLIFRKRREVSKTDNGNT